MTAIEDEAIKKMPAEDQRAAEGPDRPQVVAKSCRILDGQGEGRVHGARRRNARTLEKQAAAAARNSRCR